MTITTTSLPNEQQLDSWKEPPLETEGRAEKVEAGIETLFDQTDIVSKQADAYWQEYVSKRKFESDEAIFFYNGRTHQDRETTIERLEKDTSECLEQIGASTDEEAQKQMKQKVVLLRELRSQVIMEQAWSDVAYLYDRRAKIESETSELAQNAENQHDVEELKHIAEKTSYMADRLTRFGLYAESALNLFKKYRDLAPDIAEFTKGYAIPMKYVDLVPGLAEVTSPQPNQRYDSVMYQLLVSVEGATGRNLEISSRGDRNYLTTFEDMRDRVLQVDYKRLVILIAARVKQLEAELAGKADQKIDETEEPIAAPPKSDSTADQQSNTDTNASEDTEKAKLFGGSFDDILATNEEAIAFEKSRLDSAGKEELRDGQEAIVVEKTAEKSDLKAQKEARLTGRQQAITAAMNEVFAGKGARNAP